MKRMLLFILMLLAPPPVAAFCFQAAGERYLIDSLLLEAIATQESSLNPLAIHVNRASDGRPQSTDYGLMQINSRHLPSLIPAGIIGSEQELLNNACLNVHIGAWILAKHLRICGVSWDCLGSYNAGFSVNNAEKRLRYARRIHTIYRELLLNAQR